MTTWDEEKKLLDKFNEEKPKWPYDREWIQPTQETFDKVKAADVFLSMSKSNETPKVLNQDNIQTNDEILSSEPQMSQPNPNFVKHWSVKHNTPPPGTIHVDPALVNIQFNDVNKREMDLRIPYEAPEPPKCDCGGSKARTTHSDWCSYEEWCNRNT